MCNIVHSCLNFRFLLLKCSNFVASWSSGNIMALTLIQHTIHKLANLISYFCLLYVLNSCCNHGFGGPNENATHYTQGLMITISNQLFVGEILKMKHFRLQKITHCANVCILQLGGCKCFVTFFGFSF